MWPFDQNNQPMYQQYAQAYDNGNYNGIDQNQAFGHIQQFMQGAPYDLQQRVFQQHFEQMPYEQRSFLAQQIPQQYGMDINNPLSMSQSFMRLGQEQPHILRQILGHPFLLGGGLALAGLVAKHMIDQHRQEYGHQGFNQGYANPGFNQGYGNQGYGNQDQYLQQELNQERREERELRSELRREERREERLEEREEHHHRRRDDDF